jgi:hypothetical protein
MRRARLARGPGFSDKWAAVGATSGDAARPTGWPNADVLE